MFCLQGRVVVATGATAKNGLCRQIVAALARQGADIALLGRQAESLAEIAKGISSMKRGCFIQTCDVLSEPEVDAAISSVKKEYGRIDILLNGAFIMPPDDALTVSMESWDRVVNTNLRGKFFMCRAVSEIMAAQKYGRIINLAYYGSHRGHTSFAGFYAAEGGIPNMTAAMAAELAPQGINVNAIGVGLFDEHTLNQLFTGLNSYDYLNRTPLGRLGFPGELDALAVFLASEEASFITGETIYCDGGVTHSLWGTL